ncbi:MAG: DUF86 domain-containing protein [Mucilaginibacter polytrichastri]|nr:DUF86 domain-containing protein [Mucilaginibacter polytrichastri]
MPPSTIEFLRHILDECNYLLNESASATFPENIYDERLSRAVCRSLEIIGEASSKVHPDVKATYPNVPWRDMADLRNRIIHQYFGVDLDIITDVIQHEIPALKEEIEQILGNAI